jgi:hypothetical protein
MPAGTPIEVHLVPMFTAVHVASVSRVPNRSWTLVPNCQTLVGIGRDEKRDGEDERDLEKAMTDACTTGGWRRGFADRSQSQFAEQFADEIVLEATTLVKPVGDKPSVAAVLATASSIYQSLEFTAEALSASTTYLQWRATAFEGMQMRGITVLERDVSGKILAAAIHHRPRWASRCDSPPRSAIDSPA